MIALKEGQKLIGEDGSIFITEVGDSLTESNVNLQDIENKAIRSIEPLTQEDPDLLNQYFILLSYSSQDSEGPGGAYYKNFVIMSDDYTAWASKKEAKVAAAQAGLKSFNKKGKGQTGYGDIGAQTLRIEIVKLDDILEQQTSEPFPFSKNGWLSTEVITIKTFLKNRYNYLGF